MDVDPLRDADRDDSSLSAKIRRLNKNRNVKNVKGKVLPQPRGP